LADAQGFVKRHNATAPVVKFAGCGDRCAAVPSQRPAAPQRQNHFFAPASAAQGGIRPMKVVKSLFRRGRSLYMQIRRQHLFVTGLVLLLLGIQFRMIERYVLNDTSTRLLAKYFGEPAHTPDGAVARVFLASGAPANYTIRPPRWISYSLLSAGFILGTCFWPPLRK
jgi:hypothetical protein